MNHIVDIGGACHACPEREPNGPALSKVEGTPKTHHGGTEQEGKKERFLPSYLLTSSYLLISAFQRPSGEDSCGTKPISGFRWPGTGDLPRETKPIVWGERSRSLEIAAFRSQ